MTLVSMLLKKNLKALLASFEVYKTVKIQVEILWGVTPCIVVVGYPSLICKIKPVYRLSKELRNVGILPQHYTVSQPRRTQLEKH
jgi:hypothetical protein